MPLTIIGPNKEDSEPVECCQPVPFPWPLFMRHVMDALGYTTSCLSNLIFQQVQWSKDPPTENVGVKLNMQRRKARVGGIDQRYVN